MDIDPNDNILSMHVCESKITVILINSCIVRDTLWLFDWISWQQISEEKAHRTCLLTICKSWMFTVGHKKHATIFWTITSEFLDGFQHFVYQRKKEYSTLRFTYLVVPHRLWRHNIASHECLLCKWITDLMLSFEDKILLKTCGNVKDFCQKTVKGIS